MLEKAERMSPVSALVPLQNFNLSSVQGPLLAKAAMGSSKAIVIKARVQEIVEPAKKLYAFYE
jgi:hypothetical protein